METSLYCFLKWGKVLQCLGTIIYRRHELIASKPIGAVVRCRSRRWNRSCPFPYAYWEVPVLRKFGEHAVQSAATVVIKYSA